MKINSTRPFTRSEALAAGIRVSELAGPRYRRVFHGVYLDQRVRPDARQRALAALRVAPPGSYASHHTAAALWGVWSPTTAETHISVHSSQTRSIRRGIAAHRIQFEGPPVRRHGVPVSGPNQTFLELAAAGAGLVELVIVGDSLVRRKLTTPEQLIKEAEAWSGKRARFARRAARLVREGVDSPMETRLRMLIILAGLPEPVVNLIIRRHDGTWRWRFEICYPSYQVIIEYDGRHHAENSAQWNADILRREELERQGWRSVVVTAEAFYNEPVELLNRIVQALRSRGADFRVRKLSAEWSRCFPGRNPATPIDR